MKRFSTRTVLIPRRKGSNAQNIGVLINVLNQVLRTNAAILKIQSEQLALQNRKEKQSSEQFKTMYESIGKALGESIGNYKLQ
jgi:hypothetical protein